VSSPNLTPQGLHRVDRRSTPGLAVFERRTNHPEAVVIAIHGGLDRGGSFARLARRLEHYDLVTYDRRGYQASRDLTPLSLEHHVADLAALARDERERGLPLIALGHSYGGVVAVGAALDEPSLFNAIVNFESPFPWIHHRESSQSTLGDDPAYEAERFFRRMVSNGAWERLSEAERESRRLDGPGLMSDLGLLRSGAVPYDISNLAAPTHYLYGDGILAEYYTALAHALEERSSFITATQIAHTNHGAHLSSPDALASALTHCWEATCASA